MKQVNNIDTMTSGVNKGVDSAILRGCVIVYLAMTFYEFAFSTSVGSVLKFFGLAIMAFWLMLVLRKRMRVRINVSTCCMLVWLLVNFISLLWSKDFSTGIYYVFSTGNMICFLIMVQNICWRQSSINKLLFIYACSATALAFLLITNGDLYHGVGIRYTFSLWGQEMDPNGISAFLAPPAIISLHFFIHSKKGRIFTFISFGMCVVGMMFVGSRGGLVSLLVGVGIYLIMFLIWDKKAHFSKMFKIGLLIILGVVVVALVSKYVSASLLTRLFEFDQYTVDGGSDRLDLWRLALEYFRQSPVFGLGLASYYAITKRGIHNMYLSVLCDAGLFSLIPFIGAFASLMKPLCNRKHKLGIALMTCMMVYIFFLDTYQKKIMWNIFIMITIFLTNHEVNTQEKGDV